MPRQTIPMGTFTSATTAPVGPLHCPAHPLRCSYSSLWRKGVIFLGGEGLECPRLCPHLPQPPQALSGASLCPPSSSPVGQVTALHCEGPREPWRIPQMERGNRRQRPQLCGATKSPRVTERNMGRKERDGEKGDKERLRERGRARERWGRRRWCLFKEGGVPKCKECVCCTELRVCECLRWKNVQVLRFLCTFVYVLVAIFITKCSTCQLQDVQLNAFDLLVSLCRTFPASLQTLLSFRPIILSCYILTSSDVAIWWSEVKQMSPLEPSVKDLIVSRLDSRDFRGATLSLLLKSSPNPGSSHNR